MSEWDLFLLLPNLSLKGPTPFKGDIVEICSSDPAALPPLRDSPANETNLQLLERFRTTFGERYRPACLIVDAAEPRVLAAEVLRDFRNCCAAASVVGGMSVILADRGQWLVNRSDFFLFNHHLADKTGWVGTLDGISRGVDDDPAPYVGTCAAMIRNPEHFETRVDTPLLDLLLGAWRRHHFSQRRRRPLRQVFRALEIAFHAARYPSDGLTTKNDIGTRIGLWVSAFEALFHPGRSSVNRRVIELELKRVNWVSFETTRRRYAAQYRGQRYRASLPEKLYSRLYEARNQFQHGDRVSGGALTWKYRNRPAPLDYAAPVLFGAALRAKLQCHRPEVIQSVAEHFFGIGQIERALRVEAQRGREG